jgi:hypothetical protein
VYKRQCFILITFRTYTHSSFKRELKRQSLADLLLGEPAGSDVVDNVVGLTLVAVDLEKLVFETILDRLHSVVAHDLRVETLHVKSVGLLLLLDFLQRA